MDDLYGSILGYEGRPPATLIAYTDALNKELGDVAAEFKTFEKGPVAKVNAALEQKKLPPIGSGGKS
jgi:hypothetical protein